jgi:hypothetical protein
MSEPSHPVRKLACKDPEQDDLKQQFSFKEIPQIDQDEKPMGGE